MESGSIMRRASGWMVCLAFSAAGTLHAQQWNDSRALTLVRQATDRRAQQLADSGLVDYRATAHGYLTFLAQFGEGFREPPQVVKADELALEVYWRAPNLSKQRIVGRRDTTLLPTDIQYHRDHLGIVQNNFPAIIRLGDGDEVRDVPHPLSALGLPAYDFAIADSLRITIPGRVINVYEVKVRPRNDREPRVIGALYLDRDNGQVVRMALSFTRAAFLDRQLEDLFVVLENGLVGTRFWLPRRQEIEIRRSATWLEYPIRGIIRGRWEIANYAINQYLPPSLFNGPEIVQAPARDLGAHPWPNARILDSLPPDIRAVTADEIRRVQEETRALVRDDALRRARGSALAASGLSDFARFNRVEGLALGAGLARRLGHRLSLAGRARYGLADRTAKGVAEARFERGRATLRVFAADEFRDVGQIAERSTLVNSLAAQEFGSDYTNPYRVRSAGAATGVALGSTRWSLEAARETHEALAVHASSAIGRFVPPVPAAGVRGWRTSLRMDQPTRLAWWDLEARATAGLRLMWADGGGPGCSLEAGGCGRTTVGRGDALLELERPLGGGGSGSVFTRSIVAAVWGRTALLAQDLVFLGGPASAPGYDFHSLVGDRAGSQRVEVRVPVPFPAINLGRFGRSAARATLAPHVTASFVHAVRSATGIARSVPLAPGAVDPLRPVTSGIYPSAGVTLIVGFDLLRFDLSRGLRGGNWAFSFDVSRLLWSIL
ncbi:MAG: hypothetical protein WD801_14310 [Gemmatimonadaceae bacterium]